MTTTAATETKLVVITTPADPSRPDLADFLQVALVDQSELSRLPQTRGQQVEEWRIADQS